MTTVINTNAGPMYASSAKPNLRNAGGSRGLAIAQILLGGILILLDAIGLGMGFSYMDFATAIGGGIWSGILFIVTGALGVAAARKPTENVNRRGLFTAFLVMSIISSLNAAALIITSSFALIFSTFYGACLHQTYSSIYGFVCVGYIDTTAMYALRITSMVIYIIIGIMFVVTAAFSCCNVSSTSSHQVVTTQQVIYHAHPGQAPPVQYYPPTGHYAGSQLAGPSAMHPPGYGQQQDFSGGLGGTGKSGVPN